MDTPEAIVKDEPKYRAKAWEQYTPEQLAQWAILLTTRATHRAPDQREKIEKDIQDGRAYLAMLTSWMDEMNEKARG